MKKNVAFSIAALVCFSLLLSFPSGGSCEPSGKKPLWEFGLFNAAARVPHYRGADEHGWYVLPLPYLIYRGEFLRANREGLRGVFLDTEYFETDISLSGVPPVEDNDAREGMSDLDAVFEVGPALKYHPLGRLRQDSLYLEIAGRAAFSLGFHGGMDVSYRGLKYGLCMAYSNRSLFARHDLSFHLKAGVDFSNSELHGYYYDVPREDVRPDRPLYDSDGGYSGFSVSASMSKKLSDRFSLGFYSRWENLSGAAYEDSPLVKQEDNFTVGAALVWTIAKSKTLVAREE